MLIWFIFRQSYQEFCVTYNDNFFRAFGGGGIYYSYHDRITFKSGKDIISFYKRRAVAILPAYYLAHIIVLLFNYDQWNSWAILTPIEIIGIQTWFHTLFGILDIGGTWFISCIILGYFIYPILHEIANSISQKSRTFICVLIYLVLCYSNFVIKQYGLATTYSNPLFRTLEIAFGVFLVSNLVHSKRKREGINSQRIRRSCILVLLLMVVAIINRHKIVFWLAILSQNYEFTFLLIVILISTLFYIRCDYLERSKILKYGSALTYSFYLNQLYLWNISDIVLSSLGMTSNKSKIIISLIICIVVAILIYEFFEKPVKTAIINISSKKQ